jgi:hypothetical protein
MPDDLRAAVDLRAIIDGLGSGPPTTFEAAAALEISRCWAILLQKHRMRGVANLVEQGEPGIINRLVRDKGERVLAAAQLASFVAQATQYGIPAEILSQHLPTGYEATESVEDDLRDIVNYAILDLLLRQGWLTLPDSDELT